MMNACCTNVLGVGFLPGGSEWIILVIIGLLLFGRKLPGIARSLGQSVVEFKKGIKGVQDDIEESSGKKEEPKQEPAKIPHEEKQSTIDVQAQSRPVQEQQSAPAQAAPQQAQPAPQAPAQAAPSAEPQVRDSMVNTDSSQQES